MDNLHVPVSFPLPLSGGGSGDLRLALHAIVRSQKLSFGKPVAMLWWRCQRCADSDKLFHRLLLVHLIGHLVGGIEWGALNCSVVAPL
jgi:hypothetical protein